MSAYCERRRGRRVHFQTCTGWKKGTRRIPCVPVVALGCCVTFYNFLHGQHATQYLSTRHTTWSWNRRDTSTWNMEHVTFLHGTPHESKGYIPSTKVSGGNSSRRVALQVDVTYSRPSAAKMACISWPKHPCGSMLSALTIASVTTTHHTAQSRIHPWLSRCLSSSMRLLCEGGQLTAAQPSAVIG